MIHLRLLQRLGVATTVLLAAALTPRGFADTIQVTASAAGLQAPTGITSYYETFDSASLSSTTLTTTFNGSGITGTYSGSGLAIEAASVFGGAGGTGKYLAATDGGSYTLLLSSSVNYFGLWDSALDGGNQISLYSGSTLVYTFTPASFIALVGSCPSASTGYCGNPNSGYVGTSNDDSSQQFAYLNFYDTNGSFNRIVFSEAVSDGQFESDNQAVANLTSAPGGVVIPPVPEPSSLLLLGTGVMSGLGVFARQRKIGRVTAGGRGA